MPRLFLPQPPCPTWGHYSFYLSFSPFGGCSSPGVPGDSRLEYAPVLDGPWHGIFYKLFHTPNNLLVFFIERPRCREEGSP